MRPYLATPGEVGVPRARTGDGGAARAAAFNIGGSCSRRCRALSAPTRIVYCQFGQSRFSIIIAIGPPIVSPGAHAREDVRAVGLDGHAAAASVAALPPAEVARDGIEIEREAGRDAFENHHERAPVRLASCEKSHHSMVDCILSFCAPPGADARRSPSKLATLRRGGALAVIVAQRCASSWRIVSWRSAARGSISPPVRPCACIVAARRTGRRRRSSGTISARNALGLRHPLLNVLIDYGPLSRGGTFEAYSIRDPVRVSGAAAPALLQHAGAFLQSHGLPLSAEISRVAAA